MYTCVPWHYINRKLKYRVQNTYIHTYRNNLPNSCNQGCHLRDNCPSSVSRCSGPFELRVESGTRAHSVVTQASTNVLHLNYSVDFYLMNFYLAFIEWIWEYSLPLLSFTSFICEWGNWNRWFINYREENGRSKVLIILSNSGIFPVHPVSWDHSHCVP